MTEQFMLFDPDTMEIAADVVQEEPTSQPDISAILPPQPKPDGRKSKLAQAVINHRKELIHLIQEVGYGMDRYRVFRDFVEMAALAIANQMCPARREEYDRREERYKQIISDYEPKDQAKFPDMFIELTEALEQDGTDVLGPVFQELEINDKWKGQFFTPSHLARLMAEMNLTDEEQLRTEIDQKGLISVLEPTCGAGVMVIEFANVLWEMNINFHDHMLAVCVDVDPRAVHMCYAQLSILGIPAIVIEGDSISMKMREYWHTPFFYRHPKFFQWEQRQMLENRKEEERE